MTRTRTIAQFLDAANEPAERGPKHHDRADRPGAARPMQSVAGPAAVGAKRA